MWTSGRPTEPHRIVDVAWIVLVVVLIEVLVWTGEGPGTPIAGPRWLTVPWPVLLFVPFFWRRSHPLTAGTASLGALALQAVVSRDSPEGLADGVALGLAAYSFSAYATRAQAIVGLLPLTASFTVYTLFNHDAMSGRAQDQWAVGFFAIFTFGWWVVGFAAHEWRLARANAALAREYESRAAAAVASERARIARELHDVVSHRLSAVVVQAEGAQARAEAGGGGPSTETLAKIERSGREAMVEMRRMLDVLRGDDEIVPIAPTPEFADVPALIETFRRDGLDVSYACDPADLTIASGVGVTIHRLVHEALTNVLRHGATASARVTVTANQGQVLVRVADDGDTAHQGFVEGHGLTGMRERVALSGGTLTIGRHLDGGFVVEARFPLPEVDT